jgi:hypothetical protein
VLGRSFRREGVRVAKHDRRLAIGALAWLVAGAAAAQSLPVPTPAGVGVLAGTAKLRLKPCGRSEVPLAFRVEVEDDGAWAADAPVGLAGTSTTRLTWRQFYAHFRSRTRLALSSASLTALEASLAAQATALCGESVSLSALAASEATLVLNKRWTRAKLRLRASAQGVRASGTRTLRYRATAVGAWTPDA